MTTTMPITTSKINAVSISTSNYAPFSKREGYNILLEELRKEIEPKKMWFTIQKKNKFKQTLSKTQELIKGCEETQSFEGREETLLTLSIFEVQLRERIKKTLF